MAYSVSQRARELGVRIALGASQRQVLGGVLGRGLRLAVIGAVVGGLLAFALGRVLQNLLVGVSASDPMTFATVVATLMAVASLATLIPALRATRIDPVKSLRAE